MSGFALRIIFLGVAFLAFSGFAQRQFTDCEGFSCEVTITHSTNGRMNGSVEVVIKNGSGGYTYHLIGDRAHKNKLDLKEKTIEDLGPGKYILVVQDRNGCQTKKEFEVN